jgi:hypothetical protein
VTTGYTAPIQDGRHTTLAEYAWHAAGAFFCEGQVSSGDEGKWETDNATVITKEIERLEAMTPLEIEKAFLVERQAIETFNREAREKHALELSRYESMLAKVRSWKPSYDEHAGLRSFMESQLVDSIKFDCGSGPYQRELPTHAAGEWHEGVVAERCRLLSFMIESQRSGFAQRKAYIAALEAEFGKRP